MQVLLEESKNKAPLHERHSDLEDPEQVLQEELQLKHYLVGVEDMN